MDSGTTSDFWWLAEEQKGQSWLVGLGHHGESDERRSTLTTDIERDRPTLLDWVHSIDDRDKGSGEFKAYPLSFINEWRSRWDYRNVYRTMKLFPGSGDGEPILGPFLVDIDSSDWQSQTLEDYEDTLRIARHTVSFITQEWGLKPEEDLRVFFSGRKGFNIEAIPSRLSIAGNVDQQIRDSAECLDTIWDEVGISRDSTTIDRVYGTLPHWPQLKHPYVRLHDSLNCWRSNVAQKCRRRVRLAVADIDDLSMERILQLAD